MRSKGEQERVWIYIEDENDRKMNTVSRSASPTTVKTSTPTSCTYGTHYPNRIFAGYLPGKVTASDLADFFSAYGVVLEGKIVLDSFGRSRRFGFVTFASPEGVKNVLSKESIYYHGKRINVGPAIKKMSPDDITPPPSPSGSDHSFDLPPTVSPVSKDRIITVPPVNGKKESGNSPCNVWTKIDDQLLNQKKKFVPLNNLPNLRNLPNFPNLPNLANLSISPNNFNQTNLIPQIFFPNQGLVSNSPMVPIFPLQPNLLPPFINFVRPYVY